MNPHFPHPASVVVTRTNRDEICIRITDTRSSQMVAEVMMTPADFAGAVTSLMSPGFARYSSWPENLGKAREIAHRQAVVPDLGYGKNAYVEWLIAHHQEDGWELDTYLSAQGSIIHNPNKGNVTLNYTVYRFVPYGGEHDAPVVQN